MTIAEKEAGVIGRAWFSPDVVSKLTVGKVAKEAEKLGLFLPHRCGLQQSLIQFGRQLQRGQFVKLTKLHNISRADVVKL